MNKLKAHFKTLKENMKGMTFKEKLDHIWTYYKEYMFVAGIIVLILIAVVGAITNREQKGYMCGMMSNTELTREGHAYMTDVFFEQVLGSPEGTIFLSSVELAETEYTVDDTHNNAQNLSAVLAQIETKNLDYMLVDEFSLRYYKDENIYLNLAKLLPAEELQQLRQADMIRDITYHLTETQAEDRPVAIDISKTSFGQDCLTTEGPVYLVIIRNTDEKDNCLKLWEHIKAWKSE